MTVWSFLEIDRESSDNIGYYFKWFIYLTNWTMTLGLIQSWIAVEIVTKSVIEKNHKFGND